MLAQLSIRNFALIEEADLEFHEGFQMISGETGAGKSLLLGAIGAISGETVRKDLVREGADQALVEAAFLQVRSCFTNNEEVLSYLDEGEDQLSISREIRSNGRNVCRLNGRLVSVGFLKQIGEKLCDIHGQNDRQQIFQADRHLSILDRFGQTAIAPLKKEYARAYTAWQELLRQERDYLSDPEERRLIIERLEYQIQDIESVSPKEGEDEELQQRRDLLFYNEKLHQSLNLSLQCLSGAGESTGAKEEVAIALGELQRISAYYPSVQKQIAKLTDIHELLEDTSSELQHILNQMDSSPMELEKIEERLDAISKLKKKYGGSIAAMYVFLDKAQGALEKIKNADVAREELLLRKKKLQTVLEERGMALRAARMATAEKMSRGIVAELSELGMEQARFQVEFREFRVEDAKAYGMESCEFMLSANRGEALKPLAKTASGGEASRIMLAIKVCLASADETPILVFDEIDTGISGKTTEVVGQKLKLLGRTHQVLCVSHQAQIAAKAENQYLIYKESDDERTRTFIRPLQTAERISEIARLLNGKPEDTATLDLARRLLEAD